MSGSFGGRFFIGGIKLSWQATLGAFAPVTILVSGGVAIWGISKAAETARKRATLDLIEKSESGERYQKNLVAFKDSLGKPEGEFDLAELIDPSNDEQKAIRRKVHQFLNHYELISIGIIQESLHENTYKNWMMTTFVRDWNSASRFIQRERWRWDGNSGCWLYNNKLYENFEEMATKWAAENSLECAEISDTTTNHPAQPRGPGDQAVPRANSDDCASLPAANIPSTGG